MNIVSLIIVNEAGLAPEKLRDIRINYPILNNILITKIRRSPKKFYITSAVSKQETNRHIDRILSIHGLDGVMDMRAGLYFTFTEESLFYIELKMDNDICILSDKK